MRASILILLPSLIYAHSWLECAKYGTNPSDANLLTGKTYDINQCQGFARDFGRVFGPKASHVFGNDRGFNVQPGTKFCNDRPLTYTTDYPKAQYNPGERVRLTWPAKNHDAATCTNPFIPDTAMKIYVTAQSNGINGPTSLGTQATNPASGWKMLADFKASQLPSTATPEGFQRCPDFCGPRGTDKAICFQDMVIPNNLPAGQYTFLWYWIFNQGSGAYTTCWDATVGGSVVTTTTTTTTTTRAGQPPQSTTTSTTTTTTQSGGTGAERSVRIEFVNTAGKFDQTKLINAIVAELSLTQQCKVVTTTFSLLQNSQTGQNQWTAIFFVNVPSASATTQSAKVDSPGFLNAINAATGGSNSIKTPVIGAAVSDHCQSTTTASISRFTISMVVAITGNPPTSLAGALATAMDDSLLASGIKSDVSCLSVPGTTTGAFNCAVIVFTVADVVSVSNMVGTKTFITDVAGRIPASANNGQTVAAASMAVSNVPQNAVTDPKQPNVGVRVRGLFGVVVCLVVMSFL